MDASTAPPALLPMRNQIRDYAWGSTYVLAELQQREPTGHPEAELWMGAHPGAPSEVVVGRSERDPLTRPLTELVGADPSLVLGPAVQERFAGRLPYMLKVLAIAHPLSLQVHPDAERARAVFGRDGSPYVDEFHKPEMLHAIEPVEALFGFRPAREAAGLLAALELDRLAGLRAALAGDDEAAALHAALRELVGWPAADRPALVTEVAAAAARLADADPAYGWVARLAGLHPADPLVLAPLVLALVRIAPGESLFVRAGVPHSYLSGVGVEVLAASDNVVRAGLTPKPVDVEELLAIVDCRPHADSSRPAELYRAGEPLGPHEVAWRPPVEDFQLSRVRVPDGLAVPADPSLAGPQIVLCTHGKVSLGRVGRDGDEDGLTLSPGRSAFVTAAAGPLLLTGEGEVFRAAPGRLGRLS